MLEILIRMLCEPREHVGKLMLGQSSIILEQSKGTRIYTGQHKSLTPSQPNYEQSPDLDASVGSLVVVSLCRCWSTGIATVSLMSAYFFVSSDEDTIMLVSTLLNDSHSLTVIKCVFTQKAQSSKRQLSSNGWIAQYISCCHYTVPLS